MKSLFKIAAAFAVGTAVTLAGLSAGYLFYNKAPKSIPKAYAEPMVTAEPVVGENTVVRYVYTYTDDDEQMFYEEKAPSYLLGLTAEGVKSRLRGYEVCELSDNSLVVKKTIEGRSNAHYSISEKDGYVAVFFENGILKEKTAAPVDSLPEEIKAQVIKGIKIDGREELERYLEEIES